MHWEQMGLLNYNKYFNSIYVFVDALVYSVCDFLLRNAGDKFLLSYVFFIFQGLISSWANLLLLY